MWLAFDEAAFASSLREEVNDAIIAAVGWCCCVVWCSAWFFVTSYVDLCYGYYFLWAMGSKEGGRWDCSIPLSYHYDMYRLSSESCSPETAAGVIPCTKLRLQLNTTIIARHLIHIIRCTPLLVSTPYFMTGDKEMSKATSNKVLVQTNTTRVKEIVNISTRLFHFPISLR